MRYLSVCSGIEAATVAWHPLGWRPVAFAEISPFPSAVLAYRYPEVPNLGDFTPIQREHLASDIDLLVGGTPCQSFSVAGLRGGLADERGNLALEYLRLADRLRPRWLVWENVPGVLSSNGGRDFGAILGGMVELGYGFAYRVLDAQHFGIPQRRRRVFVVGYLGDWRRAAAVLFERHSLQGHSAPSRQAREGIAPTISSRPTGGGGLGTDFDLDGGLIAKSLNAHPSRSDAETETFVTHALRAEGFDASEDGTGRGTPLVAHAFDARQSDVIQYGDFTGPLDTDGHTMAIAFSSKDHGADAGDLSPTLRAGGHSGSHANAGVPPAIAFRSDAGRSGEARTPSPDAEGRVRLRDPGFNVYEETAPTLDGGTAHGVGHGLSVRRLTPRECERLQGFPDDYSLVPYRGKPAADGPRYKALGNSMAVPVMRWIGERIDMVDRLTSESEAA